MMMNAASRNVIGRRLIVVAISVKVRFTRVERRQETLSRVPLQQLRYPLCHLTEGSLICKFITAS
jgi:hypothetical protein